MFDFGQMASALELLTLVSYGNHYQLQDKFAYCLFA
jgi:hypothetical protein